MLQVMESKIVNSRIVLGCLPSPVHYGPFSQKKKGETVANKTETEVLEGAAPCFSCGTRC